MRPIPIPAQVQAKDGVVQIPDTRLWYWDTGGQGVPIMLLHPATGSALIWGYQQPVLAKAGYRVIAYSRRGYYNSAHFDRNNPGIGSEDLRQLADVLGLGRFHVVASAAGGSIASDFAFSYQDRLLSLTISAIPSGYRDEVARRAAFIAQRAGRTYRPNLRGASVHHTGRNPAGVKAWMELEHKALIGPDYRQTLKNEIRRRGSSSSCHCVIAFGTATCRRRRRSRHDRGRDSNSRLVLMPRPVTRRTGSSRRSSIAPCSTSSAASRNSAKASQPWRGRRCRLIFRECVSTQ
jgi:pimeloyl-ACP methyl ester carboxylesterase